MATLDLNAALNSGGLTVNSAPSIGTGNPVTGTFNDQGYITPVNTAYNPSQPFVPPTNQQQQTTSDNSGLPKDSQGANVGNVRQFGGKSYAWNGNQWQPYNDATWAGSWGGGTSSLSDAATQKMNADIQSATDQYNAIYQNLEQNKAYLGNTYNTGLTDINNQINQSEALAGTNKTQLQQQGNQQKTSAYQNYQTAQRQNREAGRAAGAGASSSYLDTQGQTNNSYGQTIAGITTNLTNQIANIDTSINTLNQNATNAVQKLQDQYQNSVKQIVLNESQTDTQKADAIAQIRAQNSTQMAQINTYAMQLQNQMELAQQQMQNQLEVAKTYASAYSSQGYNNQNTTISSPTLGTSTAGQSQVTTGIGGHYDSNGNWVYT